MVPDETGDPFLYLTAFAGSFHQIAHSGDFLAGLLQLVEGEILFDELQGGHERVTGSADGQVCLGCFEMAAARRAKGEKGFEPGELAPNPGGGG